MPFNILAAARKRDRAIQKINDLADTIAQHIVYCYLYSDSSDYKNWLEKITSELLIVYKLTNIRNNSMKIKYLHDALYNSVLETRDELKDFGRFAEEHMRFQEANFDFRRRLPSLHTSIARAYVEIEETIMNRTFLMTNCELFLRDHIRQFIALTPSTF